MKNELKQFNLNSGWKISRRSQQKALYGFNSEKCFAPSIQILHMSQPFLSKGVFKVINFLDSSSSSSHFRCLEVAISAIACYFKNLKNAWCLRFVAQLNLEKSSKGQHYHRKPSSQWSLNFQKKWKLYSN